MKMDSELTLMIAMAPIVVIFYAYFIYRYFRRDFIRNLYKRYFRATLSILSNVKNDDDCIQQLNLDFKKLSEKYPNLSADLKSSADLLEEMIYELDTLGDKRFSQRYDIEVQNDTRNRIIGIISIIKDKNPFVSLSSKEANLLVNLKHSIESGNKDLGHTILKQLSDEMEILESNIKTQDKRNDTSYIIAAVGIVLTVFFGILSFVKL